MYLTPPFHIYIMPVLPYFSTTCKTGEMLWRDYAMARIVATEWNNFNAKNTANIFNKILL